MNNELTETRITEQPQWLELSEPEKARHTYWSVTGDFRKKPWSPFRGKASGYQTYPVGCYHSKEEAEADAVRKCHGDAGWIWNGKPATAYTLQSLMDEARVERRPGVCILGWNGSEVVILKFYPANEPLVSE